MTVPGSLEIAMTETSENSTDTAAGTKSGSSWVKKSILAALTAFGMA